MKISMYQASAPRFANTLRNLSAILDKAQVHCDAKKIDPAVMGGMRLIADMFPLSRQVQIACDTAKGAVARLAGVDIPKHDDTEHTFAELKQRIAKTVDFILSTSAEKIEGSDERTVTLKLGGKDTNFTGMQYLLGHAYPNFYFHVTTAYNILRANGVDIGKRDYIGTP
jgi:uncharacterized protein